MTHEQRTLMLKPRPKVRDVYRINSEKISALFNEAAAVHKQANINFARSIEDAMTNSKHASRELMRFFEEVSDTHKQAQREILRALSDAATIHKQIQIGLLDSFEHARDMLLSEFKTALDEVKRETSRDYIALKTAQRVYDLALEANTEAQRKYEAAKEYSGEQSEEARAALKTYRATYEKMKRAQARQELLKAQARESGALIDDETSDESAPE